MNEWVVLVKGQEQMRVRPRGVDALLAQGWTILGANQESQEPQVPEATPAKPRRKTK